MGVKYLIGTERESGKLQFFVTSLPPFVVGLCLPLLQPLSLVWMRKHTSSQLIYIFRKLDVVDRTAAVTIALEQGIIQLKRTSEK